MKKLFILSFILILLLTACGEGSIPSIDAPSPSDANLPEGETHSTGGIYLYGESHGNEAILEKELELWYNYYHEQDLRHLFIEYPYYTAEFLNLWMQAEDDAILDEVYDDWSGTLSHVPCVKEFFQEIKATCPETVFHGTDVGHAYSTTGQRYLNYLRDQGLTDSPQYQLALEAISQGKTYYQDQDHIYRENMMAANFIREFDRLGNKSVMGIYGSDHTDLDAMDHHHQQVPCMAAQLAKVYGDAVHSEDLTLIAKDIEPLRVDTIIINGKEYEASYFGEQDISSLGTFLSREFWRLENAYEDFKGLPAGTDFLPYDNYPMIIETGQIFVIDYHRPDGSVERRYYRSDGMEWDGMPITILFTLE